MAKQTLCRNYHASHYKPIGIYLLKVNNGNIGAIPANIYLFKVKNRNTRKRCEISSKLTVKRPERLLRPATLLKTRLWYRCFPVNFAKFLRTLFLTEHLQWLLLKSYHKMPTHTTYETAHAVHLNYLGIWSH